MQGDLFINNNLEAGNFVFSYNIHKYQNICRIAGLCKIYKQAARQNFSIHPQPFIIAWNLKWMIVSGVGADWSSNTFILKGISVQSNPLNDPSVRWNDMTEGENSPLI